MKPTPTQRRDRTLKYVLYCAILGLGVAVGIAIRHYHDIPIAETIDIVDVATLIVTIFLAVYIPGVFDRQLQVKQDKKEWLEQRVGELQGFYRMINQLVQRGIESEQDIFVIRNTLDVATNRLNVIITLFDYLQLRDSFAEELTELESLNTQYQNLLLETLPKQESLIYPQETRRREEALYNRIDRATSILVFKISDV